MGTDEQGQGATVWTIGEIEDLKIEGRQQAGVLVAQVNGRVDGVNSLKFQDALATVLDQNITALVLDFEHLSYISSAGLRVVLFVGRELQSRDKKFVVCSLSEPVGDVFRVSGFDKIVSIYATQLDALSALNE